MNRDEQDTLWELLGKVKKTEVSPFFARNLLREIRAQKPARNRFFAWLPWNQFAALTASIILLTGAIITTVSMTHSSIAPHPSHLIATTPDLETLNHLDELLAYEESSTWLDHSSY